MKYFLDTNILVDLVTMRAPFGKVAAQLFETAKKEKWELFSSAISITTTHYILSKSLDNRSATEVIGKILDLLTIVPADSSILRRAVSHPISDYEDAVQFECAASLKGVDGFITRNKKDFKHASIPVFAPEEVLF
ncbi:hypothetical protein AAU57_00430 [Nonlabens sp. YIK11]|uniref:type II toxin-antitoxin system VapC family toxin n=1 Tax=Nonlabens sp. YIK11 TaxID=1453349 RepID=UPI0006DCEBE2|nr:PIN domain-containing protein [Nonlabens sp. YIK11]KQC31957.1 hypothetical protein AAU57_00430 [Nonlabens sp. YIK11]